MAYVHPVSSALFILGLFLMAFPVVGIVVLILAVLHHRRYRKGITDARRAVAGRERERIDTEFIAAFRGF